MTRIDFQRISNLRIKEARLLLNGNEFSGSYYLCGYSLECAFKSCIAKSYSRHIFPDKKKVIDSHTHNLERLMNVTDLEDEFRSDTANNPELRANWATAKD